MREAAKGSRRHPLDPLYREALRRKLEVVMGARNKRVHIVDAFMRDRTACGQAISLGADRLTLRRADIPELCGNCDHALHFVLDCARIAEERRGKAARP